MRYININDIELPEGWEEKAEDLKQQLLNTDDQDERNKIIDDHPIWTELLVPLKKLSNGKCWYSEAQEVMSDLDVDHFRPKKEAKSLNGDKRKGYWYLAFSWRNYRLSSIYSNRLRKDKHTEENKSYGKGAYFPLRDGINPANNEDELPDEIFVLLDPANENDPNIISFNQDGIAVSAVNDDQPWDHKRANTSINLYHLNHTPLKEARKVIWNRCQRIINHIITINRKQVRTVRDDETLHNLTRELRELSDRKSEFSGAVISCIESNDIRLRA